MLVDEGVEICAIYQREAAGIARWALATGCRCGRRSRKPCYRQIAGLDVLAQQPDGYAEVRRSLFDAEQPTEARGVRIPSAVRWRFCRNDFRSHFAHTVPSIQLWDAGG